MPGRCKSRDVSSFGPRSVGLSMAKLQRSATLRTELGLRRRVCTASRTWPGQLRTAIHAEAGGGRVRPSTSSTSDGFCVRHSDSFWLVVVGSGCQVERLDHPDVRYVRLVVDLANVIWGPKPRRGTSTVPRPAQTWNECNGPACRELRTRSTSRSHGVGQRKAGPLLCP